MPIAAALAGGACAFLTGLCACLKSGLADRLGQVVKLDLPAGCNDDGTLDRVFELADIAGPIVIDQCPQCFFRNAGNEPARLFLVSLEKMKNQQMNVLDPLPERRQR